MDLSQPSTLRVTCGRGLSPWLEGELRALGYAPAQADETGVELAGTLHDAMRLNLHLRTAYHVLYRLARFRCLGADALYEQVEALPWEELIPADGYVSVTSRVDTTGVSNSMFANLRVKDAIVDRISTYRGRRPDSGPDREAAVVNLFWRGAEAWIYLDTSGRKLSDRGYRRLPHTAPMRETLAAAALLATGYDGTAPLVNPMCGSGTLAIEAALIATRRAPGLLRTNFGFIHLLPYDRAAWEALRAEASAAGRAPPAPIVASDADPRAVEATAKNAAAAGVERLIDLRVCPFEETPVPEGEGVCIFNPEYGERLGERAALEATYSAIGDFFKQRCAGYTGYVFTGNLALAKRIGLRTRRRVTFFNGAIESRLLEYELYRGTRRKRDPDATASPAEAPPEAR